MTTSTHTPVKYLDLEETTRYTLLGLARRHRLRSAIHDGYIAIQFSEDDCYTFVYSVAHFEELLAASK